MMYMHELGIVHADVKPGNILMRPESWAALEWIQWVEDSAQAASASDLSTSGIFLGCIGQLGPIFKVVLSDLGNAELADPRQRWKQKVDVHGSVKVCTAEYRPPDLFLGNANFDQALDMWSLGCVAAELVLRSPLFTVSAKKPLPADYLAKHAWCLTR